MGAWTFLHRKAGRLSGDACRNTFEGKDPVTCLAREAIQNSVDARSGPVPVSVTFTWKEDLDLSAVLTNNYWAHALHGGVRSDRLSRCRALLIEDFNTSGLTGSMADMNSNFFKLLGALGGSTKAGGDGGSFGYGKAAVILNSAVWTVIAFTITEDGPALCATSYFNEFESNTGIGWFCEEGGLDDEPLEIIGDEAVELAVRLGIDRGRSLEIGTSLLIPEPTVTLDQLKIEVERYWWPRLVSHKLSVVFADSKQRVTATPKTLDEVKPYVELFDIALKRALPGQGECVRDLVHRGKKLGTLAMRMDDSLNVLSTEESKFGCSIALMRDTLMVVDYYHWNLAPRPGLVGVFVADERLNDDLRMTEPPQHDDWSQKATRASAEQRETARVVKERIRREHNNFVKEYDPPPEEDDRTLTDVRRFFGSLLGSPGKSNPDSKAEPIEIFDRKVHCHQAGDYLVTAGTARFRYQGLKSATLRLSCKVVATESDDSDTGEALPCEATFSLDGKTLQGSQVDLDMGKGDVVECDFKSLPYDPNWTVSVQFSGEVLKGS